MDNFPIILGLLVLFQISTCSHALNCQDLCANLVIPQSERVKNTINSINQAFEENQQHGCLNDANLRLRNGFVNFTYAVSDIELNMMDEFNTAERYLTDKPAAAAEAIRRANEAAQNGIYNKGSTIFQTLGETMILSNANTKQGLAGASHMLQQIGTEVLNQMNNTMGLFFQGINAGEASARQAINAARYTIESIFAAGYDVLRQSHQLAANTIAYIASENVSPYAPIIVNQNAEIGARDLDTAAAIAVINEAAETALQGGAESGKVYRLKEMFISAVCDFAKLSADARDYLAQAQHLADSDPTSAKDGFLRNAEETGGKVHGIIGNMILEISGLGLNSDDSTKWHIEQAVVSLERAIVELFTGTRSAVDLTIHGLGLPPNIRCYVLRAAVESGRYGKLAWLQRIMNSAKFVLQVI